MKPLKLVIIILGLVFFSGCKERNPVNINLRENTNKTLISQEADQPRIIINNNELQIEVVRTPQAQNIGLSGRTDLCNNCGMLFEFADYQIRNFWMKDMNFPLDIIWIKDDQIINISANVPLFTAGQISSVQSVEAVNKVLEVNADWVKNNNIRIDDTVEYLNID